MSAVRLDWLVLSRVRIAACRSQFPAFQVFRGNALQLFTLSCRCLYYLPPAASCRPEIFRDFLAGFPIQKENTLGDPDYCGCFLDTPEYSRSPFQLAGPGLRYYGIF